MKLLNPIRLQLKKKMRNRAYRIAFMSASINNEFAVFCYRQRKALKLTQRELGRRAEMHQSRISAIETSDEHLTINTMVRITDALGHRLKISSSSTTKVSK